MAVNLSPVGGVAAQFFDNNGLPLSGGKLYTYLAGTTTPAVTYTNNGGFTANSNPIVLNAAGRVADSGEIWLTDGVNYKFVLQDQNSVQIAVWDNVTGINSNFINYALQAQTFTATQGQTAFTLTGGLQYILATNNLAVFVNGSKQIVGTNYLETSTTVFTFLTGLNVGDVVEAVLSTTVATNVTNAVNVAYNPPFTSSVATNVQAKLGQTVSFKDFGAVGDNSTNDTTAMQNAINSITTGTIIDGNGLTYLSTGLNVNKSVIIQNCIIHMANPSSAVATQKCFNVTANNVQLINCGTLIVQAELTNVTNTAGVFANAVTNLQIQFGTYNGSLSASLYGAIYCLSCIQPQVLNTTTKNSLGDGIYFDQCTNAEAYFNYCYNNAGSGISCDSSPGSNIAFNTIDLSGQSGLACNSNYSRVAFNHVSNSATNGITAGEIATTGIEIIGNYVEKHGTNLSTPVLGGILIQGAVKAKVLNNVIAAPATGNTVAIGIAFTTAPISFECVGNQISSNITGVYVLDTGNACGGVISQNAIDQSKQNSIFMTGFNKIHIDNNIITQTSTSGASTYSGIYLDSGATSPQFIYIINNQITDSVPNEQYAIYLASTMSSSTYCKINGNLVRGWTTNAYVGNRSCIYDVAGNDWDGTAKTGLVTLTNGGTTTTVTTKQCVLNTNIVLSIGNSAAYTLNPKYYVSSLANGTFTITHTAGTVAAEQLKWVIL